MGTILDLYLFAYLSFSLFFHLGLFLGVQVTAGRDSKYLVFESFYRSSQKLSLCSTTRQPIPTVGWITCEWAVDIMTPTWLKRLCVVLAALLILSFLALGVCEMLFERTFTMKIAPLHLRVFDESTSFNLLSRQLHISFRDFNFMLKDRIGTFFFNRSSTTCEVVCQLRCVVTVGSRIFINRLIPTLLEISGIFFNFESFFYWAFLLVNFCVVWNVFV